MCVGGAKNEAAMEELNKRFFGMIDTYSDGLRKVLSRVAAAA